MKSEWAEAEQAWKTYPATEYFNTTLVRLTARKLYLTAEGAHAVLIGRVSVPTRGNKGKATTEMVAYRYLKRSVSPFFEMLGKTAVKAYVAYIHGQQGARTGE